MRRSIKAVLFAVAIVANAGVLWWRYTHEVPEIRGVGPHIASLGAAQVDTVLAWRNANAVLLTDQSIRDFADRLQWNGCDQPLQKATTVSRNDLSSASQMSLCRTIAGLIDAYSQSDPGRLYDFMSGIDEELSPSSVATLRRLLVTDGEMSEAAVQDRSARELFLMVAQRIHYGAHWQTLVADSSCATVSRTNLNQDDLGDQIPLGGSMAGRFKNQTRFHHLFQAKAKLQNAPSKGTLFADVQFVVKHDREYSSEPSAYYVRLVLDLATESWHPVEMIHVSTISGNSPALLF